MHPQARLRACHHEPRPCTRAHLPVFSMSLRASAHTGVAIRVPAAMPGKSVVLRANSQLFRIRREELLFGLCCRRSYGLPRRFAPRNDRGGGVIANQCLAPADTRHVSARLARRVLTPARTSFLLHVIARHVLASADAFLSSACHCEPVRTLVWQSVLLAVGHDRKQHFRRIRSCLRICPNSSQTG